MKGFLLFSLVVAAGVVLIPIALSWYARGWVALYDSPPYTFDNIPNLAGKVAVVTGANTGIGKVSVRELARKGATVVLTSRSTAKGKAAKKDICRDIAPKQCSVVVEELDLASFASVEGFAERVKAQYPQLHILLLNAGVMYVPFSKTAEGLELQIGTNHFGHFFLVDRLMGLLDQTPSARVVTVSSNAHELPYSGGIRFDQLDNDKNYDAGMAYGQSKLANILFSNELAKRAQDRGSSLLANAVHPGFIKTDLARHIVDQMQTMPGPIAKILDVAWQWIYTAALETDPGAYTQLYVATAPELEGVRGKYYHPIAREGTTTALAKDADLQRRLWEVSEQVVARYLSSKPRQPEPPQIPTEEIVQEDAAEPDTATAVDEPFVEDTEGGGDVDVAAEATEENQ